MRIRRCFSLIGFSFLALIALGAGWQTDYERARATAKQTRKCVLLDFTGSDWCPPCIQLRKAVFKKSAFLKYAEKNLILVEVDFPRRKKLDPAIMKQNERLHQQYGIEQSGFPTVILLDPDGKILGQLEGYADEGPADVIAWVEKLRGKLH